MSEFVKLAHRVADLERRMRGICRFGTVGEVDPAAGTVRLKLGEGADGAPYLSAPIPYAQTAGAVSFHNPPSVGQQMMAVSPDGDLRQAVAQPMGFSEAQGSPGSAGDTHVMTFGSVSITMAGDSLVITVGGSTVTIGSGAVSIVAPRIDLN